jgi:hypothetical protein
MPRLYTHNTGVCCSSAQRTGWFFDAEPTAAKNTRHRTQQQEKQKFFLY